MIVLYSGGGASDFEIVGECMSAESWRALRRQACHLLRARDDAFAAALLAAAPFEISSATNHFGDEFSVLHMVAGLDDYVAYGEQSKDPTFRGAYNRIASVISEIGEAYIRVIAVQLDTRYGPEDVPFPRLRITSEAVERALADAEHLIRAKGASSGVDRVHTALHGYLLTLCDQLPQSPPGDSGTTQLLKFLRKHHPALQVSGPRSSDIERVLTAFGSVVDALNPVRNRASGAHPNPSVLDEPEAMLVVNAVRTLLAYLDRRVQ